MEQVDEACNSLLEAISEMDKLLDLTVKEILAANFVKADEQFILFVELADLFSQLNEMVCSRFSSLEEIKSTYALLKSELENVLRRILNAKQAGNISQLSDLLAHEMKDNLDKWDQFIKKKILTSLPPQSKKLVQTLD